VKPTRDPSAGGGESPSAGVVVTVTPVREALAAVPALVARTDQLPRGLPPRAYARPFLQWCAVVRELSENTLFAYDNVLDTFVRFTEAASIASVDAVSTRTIEIYFAWLRQHRGLSVRTVNQHRGALATFWRFLMREDVTSKNPVVVAFSLRQARGVPDFLTFPEQEKVLTALSREPDAAGQQAFALIATGLLTGLRVSELSALRLDALRLQGGLLKVIDGKGHKDRLVPVIPWLAEVLKRFITKVRPRFPYAEQVPFVFVGRVEAKDGNPLQPRCIWNILARKVSPIIGRRCHPHMLRHSYATRLLAQGADLESIRLVMGHARLDTTSIYLHVPTDQLQHKIAAWLTGGLPDVGLQRTPPPAPPEPTLPHVPEHIVRRLSSSAGDLRVSHPFADGAMRKQLRERRRRLARGQA